MNGLANARLFSLGVLSMAAEWIDKLRHERRLDKYDVNNSFRCE